MLKVWQKRRIKHTMVHVGARERPQTSIQDSSWHGCVDADWLGSTIARENIMLRARAKHASIHQTWLYQGCSTVYAHSNG